MPNIEALEGSKGEWVSIQKMAGYGFWQLLHFSYSQNVNFVDNRKSESD